MNKTILVNLKIIEETIEKLKTHEEVQNYVKNDNVIDAGGNTKLFVVDLVSRNDYNCYCVSGDCSCLYNGHSNKITFSDEDVCINYLDNEIKEINNDTLEVTLNLSDDKNGYDYKDVVYEYVANKIAQYYTKLY